VYQQLVVRQLGYACAATVLGHACHMATGGVLSTAHTACIHRVQRCNTHLFQGGMQQQHQLLFDLQVTMVNHHCTIGDHSEARCGAVPSQAALPHIVLPSCAPSTLLTPTNQI
jgi:hypothetical protein